MNFLNGNMGMPGMTNYGGALPFTFMPGQMGGNQMGGNGMGCCPGYNVNIPPQMQQIAQQMQQCQMLMGFIMGMMAGMMAGQNGGMMPGMGMPGMGMPGMPGGFGMPGGGGGGGYGMPGGGYGMPGGGGGYGMPGGGYGMPGGGGGYGGGDAGSCSAGNGVVPPGNYSGPINLQRVIAAVPAGSRAAASQHFPGILAECQRQGVTSKPQIAYILATTIRESGAGAHMNEFASGDAYQGRLGNNQPGDGRRYKGRGYVQITGKSNYQNWSRKLGIDLVGNPGLATQPATAARILVQGMKEGSFTGKKLGDYIGQNGGDFTNARRVVNGTDHAGEIAGVAQRLLAAM